MKKLGVVGSGNMGNGIGQCGAQNGYDVVLYDVAEAQLEKAKSHIESSLRKRVEKGKMAQEEMDRTLANIRYSSNIGDLADRDVIVEAVVEKVEHMLLPLAQERDITVEADLQSGCVVKATEDDLYQIAFNLMENAVKYNVNGGRVMVGLRSMGDLVLLTVEDTGVGIPDEDLPKIFDRFYRVDKARSRAAGGTGLGLSIVRDTARQHVGAVTVRRREEGGTCFQVAFPRWDEEGGDLL